MRFCWVALFACLFGSLSCSSESPPPQIGVAVTALGNAGLPEDVECVSVTITIGEAEAQFSRAVASLPDNDMNGRPELVVEGDLLPEFGTPFSITLGGLRDCTSETAQYQGSTGRVVLAPGQRRIFTIALYEVGSVEVVRRGDPPPTRIMHTSTALPDGRVLIAGGFEALVDSSSDCPDDVTCYDLQAVRDAWIFDPPSGTFYEVPGGMLEARAGHSADVLPDGRVVVAGGATRARLFISATDTSFNLNFTTDSGLATFEYFDPELGAELEDIDSDGDVSAGRFMGADASPGTPGVLNDPRFLHAHAATPEGRILLAGGSGGEGAEFRYEIFDADKPGGGGVYANTEQTLQTARRSPAAVTLGDAVWIIGGAESASSDADLAEVWTGGSDPNGSTEPATELGFPGDSGPRPEFALLYPQVAASPDGDAGVVVGWYGPQCNDEGELAYGGGTRCNAVGPAARSYSFDPTTGQALSFDLDRSATRISFGAIATFGGRPVLTGGATDSRSVNSLFGLALDAERGTTAVPFTSALLGNRVFHQATPIENGALFTGGGTFVSNVGRLPRLTLLPEQTPTTFHNAL